MLDVDVSIGPYQWLGRSPSHHEILTLVQLLQRLQKNHHHHTQSSAAATTTTTTPQTSLAMDQEEMKQVQSMLKGHSLPDGGEIVGSINSSSSELNATNNRAHIVRQYESGSTASERKTTRETPDIKGITFGSFSLVCKLIYVVYVCILLDDGSVWTLFAIYKVQPPPNAQYPYPYQYPYPFPYQFPYPRYIQQENLQQYFGQTSADVAAKLGVSVSTFKRMCRRQGIEQWRNRMGSSGSVSRPPDQHGERNTSTARETPSHNVQTGIEGVPVGQNQEANELRRDFTDGSIPLNSENGLTTGSSFGWASQVNDQSTLSTPYPNHDALGFPPPQITLMPSENGGASIDLRNSLASQAEPDRHISGFSNLTFATCSDQAAPSQHAGGQAMQSTDHNAFVFPQTQMVSPQEPFPDFMEGSIPLNTEGSIPLNTEGSSFGWACQVNDQSTLSTPYPNHDALVFPPPQMTSLPSEIRAGSIDLMNSVASQAEPFSDRHISGFSNFATCSDQAAPNQHVRGQAMQSTDHNAFVFPQEPFPDFMEGSIPSNTENGLIIGSSSGRASQVNDQSTLSTPYPNHDGLVFPPPQMTSLPSENRGGSIDLRNSVASQAEPFSDRHISGSRNLAFRTRSYQAAPSQHVDGQAMQSTDHNAFVFPQTRMVSPQEPFPAGHVFEFSNWNMHTNSVKIKAFYGEAIYKFLFPLTSGIDDLKKEVSKRLNVEVDRFEVKYMDEFGHLILIPCNEDWILYLSSSWGNDEIRVLVHDKVGGTLNSCESCRSLMQRSSHGQV